MFAKTRLVYAFLLIIILACSIPLFFHRLGQSSLVSFDEAWYAAIARGIDFRQPFSLYFNGQRFYDHPPAGFWFIRLSQEIFGSDEFGSRAAAAIFGLTGLGLVFILGSQISHPAVGLASAVALSSSPWFLSRARSANLDVTLTFFALLTFILAIRASRSPYWFFPFFLSLSLLLLTKTLIPFTLLPALVIIFWRSPVIKTKQFVIFLTLTLTLTLSWFLSQLAGFPGFIQKYLAIGYPKPEKTTSLWQNLLLTKTYLHESIGFWFRPIALSFPLFVFFTGLFRSRYLTSVNLFIFVFLLPFVFSSRGQIWHLLPVIPFLILVCSTLIYKLVSLVVKKPSLSAALIITLSLVFSLPQISKNWREFINIPAYVSDEAILARAASAFSEPLYIDDRFLPAAVYYSGKTVIDTPTPDFSTYFNQSNSILLITHRWRLDSFNPVPARYQVLASDRDKVLLLIRPE